MRSTIPGHAIDVRCSIAILVLFSLATSIRAQAPDPELEAAFDEQIAYLSALPVETLPPGLQQGLLAKLRVAEDRYLRGKPCTSANILTAFMNRAKALAKRPQYSEVGTDLYYRGLLLRSDVLLSLPEDQTCPQEPPDADCFTEAPWPELVAVQLESQPSLPGAGDPTVIELGIVNRGGSSALNVPVTFREQGESFADSAVDIPACGAVEVAVAWPGGEEGIHLITAQVDPDQILVEGLRSNNSAELEIGVVFEAVRPWEAPDLILEGLSATPARPTATDTVQLEVTLWHAGEEPLGDIAVVFSVDGVAIDEVSIDELDGGSPTTLSATWLATEPGRHYLTAAARLLSGDSERELDNNSQSIPLNVGGGDPPVADLFVNELGLDPELPAIGDSVTLTAAITNIGWAPATDFDVYFLADESPAVLAPGLSDVLPPPPGPVILAVVNVPLLDVAETVEIQAAIEALDRPEMTVWVHADPLQAVPKTEAPSIFAKRVAAVDPEMFCKTDQTSWFSVGPRRLDTGWVGRIDSLVLDPDDPSTLFAGSPGGGVWRSLSGGAWTPLTDRMPSLGISAMIMDPTDSDVLYAGSGAGLYKTIDGGNSWKVFASTSIGSYFDSLLLHYGGSGFTLYAATNSGLWRYEGTDKYLLQSLPAEWTRIKTGGITGLAQYPDDPDRFLVGTMHPTTGHSEVWRSKPGSPPTSDASWENLSDGTHSLPVNSDGGMRVAIAPSDSSIMYAGLFTPKQPGIDTIPRLWRLFRTSNGGDSWQLVRSQISEMNYFDYWENWYNAYVVVDPLLPNTIYLGHIQAYRSDDGGGTLDRITDIHDDQHGFAFHPDDPQIVYFVGDGGVFKCTGRGTSCTSLNDGLRVTMFYDLALASSDPSRMIGGTQDNGTIRFDGSEVWDLIRGGDGRYCEIDPLEPDVLYSQHQYLESTAKSVDGSADPPRWDTAPGLPSFESFNGTPYLFMHPNDSDVLLATGPEVYEHSSAAGDWAACPTCPPWATIGPTTANSAVTRVAIDPTTGRYFAGLANGQLWVSDHGSSTWAKVFTHPTTRPLTGIAVDPFDASRIFLTFEGWGNTDGPLRVWMIERIVSPSPDQPDLVYWQATNISGNLPVSLALGSGWQQSDMVVVHPSTADTIFVATNQGVYRGRGSQTEGTWTWLWDAYNCQLPWVKITDLEIHPVTRYLFAASYGRGLWATPLMAPD